MTIVRNPVIEAMETTRAMRFLKPDPIPDDLLETVLYAATRASSPHNTQGWTLIVSRPGEHRQRLADLFARITPVVNSMGERLDPVERRTLDGALNLGRIAATVPAIIFVCVHVGAFGADELLATVADRKDLVTSNERMMWSAGFAASQNLIVAARSLGLGTVFTMHQCLAEPEVRDVLGLPPDVLIATTIYMGWPERPFVKVKRKPLADVVRYDHY